MEKVGFKQLLEVFADLETAVASILKKPGLAAQSHLGKASQTHWATLPPGAPSGY
jgi:hypothetical protein